MLSAAAAGAAAVGAAAVGAADAAAALASSSSPPPPSNDAAVAAHACFFLSLLLLSVLASRLLHVTRFRWATEGSAALLLGVVCTGALSAVERCAGKGGGGQGGGPSSSPSSTLLPLAQIASLTSPLLFNVLLPPVVFFAGFSAKKKHLFANAATVGALGGVGTWVAAVLIAAGVAPVLRGLGLASGRPLLQASLALGAIAASSDTVAVLRAVDPVRHPNLHAMAFGEGITNDAVAIVLLSAVSSPVSPAFGGSGGGGGGGGAGGDKKWDDPASWPALAAGLLVRCAWLMVASAAFGAAFGLGSALLVRWGFLQPRLRAEEAMAFAALSASSEEEDGDDGEADDHHPPHHHRHHHHHHASHKPPTTSSSPSSYSSSSADQEVLVVALVGILSYLAADALALSGVLSVFACGAVTSHYAWHSLAPAAQSLSLHGFRVVASFCEMAMFVLAGVDAWATLLAPPSASADPMGAGGGGVGAALSLPPGGEETSLVWGAVGGGSGHGERGGRHGDGREGGSKAALQAGALAAALLGLILASRAAVVVPTAAAANNFWRAARAQQRVVVEAGDGGGAGEQEEEGDQEEEEDEGRERGAALLPRKRTPPPASAAAAAAALAPPLPLSVADTLVLYLAGLPRGAVTLALAYHHFDGGGGSMGGGRGGGRGGGSGGGGGGLSLSLSSSSSSSPSALARDDHVITVAVMGVVLTSTVALGALAGPAIAWLLREEDRGAPSLAWLRRSVGSRSASRACGGLERRPPASASAPLSAQPSFLLPHARNVDVWQLEALLRAARSGLLTRPSLDGGAAAIAVGVVGGGGGAAAAAAAAAPVPARPSAAGGGEVIGLHARWRALDAAWLQPLFGGREEAAARGAVAMSFEAFN